MMIQREISLDQIHYLTTSLRKEVVIHILNQVVIRKEILTLNSLETKMATHFCHSILPKTMTAIHHQNPSMETEGTGNELIQKYDTLPQSFLEIVKTLGLTIR
ncbi:unnamed protein product [Meganyctiphanes norvegica]|uniref:Uncharacterized protein n=1 Tax=Meganyctiphanes norvegica TaxID=48144 RepID=A0AAV2RP22_MEGNR